MAGCGRQPGGRGPGLDGEHHEIQRRDRFDRSCRRLRPVDDGDALHPARRQPARHQLHRRAGPRARAPGLGAARQRHEAGGAEGHGAHDPIRRPAEGVRRFHQRKGHRQDRGGSQPMSSYKEFHRRSIDQREAFWAEEARFVDWHKPFTKVLDYSRPPFAKWFVGGETNLCHNAIDRHLAARGDQNALVWISTEVEKTETYTYRQLHAELNRAAAMMQSLGVKRGDRGIIYMPMVPEACFAILACARIGAIHSVVFGGFAAASLAARIDDARPTLMITSDGGSRMGKAVLYKSLVDESIRLAEFPPRKVLIYRRGLDPDMPSVPGRDVDWKEFALKQKDDATPCAWLESN